MNRPIFFYVNQDNAPELELIVQQGETLLQHLIRAKVPIGHSCDGMGTCTTCRVFIRQGLNQLDPPNEIEQEHIQDRSFRPEERLACQIEPVADLRVEIPKLIS